MTLLKIATVAGAYTTALDTAKHHESHDAPAARAKSALFSGFSMPFIAVFAKRVA